MDFRWGRWLNYNHTKLDATTWSEWSAWPKITQIIKMEMKNSRMKNGFLLSLRSIGSIWVLKCLPSSENFKQMKGLLGKANLGLRLLPVINPIRKSIMRNWLRKFRSISLGSGIVLVLHSSHRRTQQIKKSLRSPSSFYFSFCQLSQKVLKFHVVESARGWTHSEHTWSLRKKIFFTFIFDERGFPLGKELYNENFTRLELLINHRTLIIFSVSTRSEIFWKICFVVGIENIFVGAKLLFAYSGAMLRIHK